MKSMIVKTLLLLLVLVTGTATGGYFALVKGVPQIEEIRGYVPAHGTKVYADDDTLIGEFKVEKGIYVPISRIPENLIRALIAVEDSRFWQHKGVDYIAIARALLKDALAGRIKEGASTITQQLAKVIFLSPEKTIARKMKEAILAFRLEKNLSKEEILELYFNRVYFGHGAYGIEMAARTYFAKSVSDVSLAEAALLSGLVKAPNKYSPYNDLDMAKERQRVVLKRMQEEGYITGEEAEKIYKQPLNLSSIRTERYAQGYFLEYVRNYLEGKYGVEIIYRGGLKVHTTLSKSMQSAAAASLQNGLRELDKRQGYRGPSGHKDVDLKKEPGLSGKAVMKEGDMMSAVVLAASDSHATVLARGVAGRIFIQDSLWAGKVIDANGKVIREYKKFRLSDVLKTGDVIRVRIKNINGGEPVFTLEQEPLAQGAVITIEPSTGYIRAMAGGYDFSKSEFNRAVYARRQAGSAFKPVIYAAAMDNGYTPATIIDDGPISYSTEQFGEWKPENYDRKYHGPTRLREALAYSRNIVTIKLLEQVGVRETIKFANTIGIQGALPYNLSLALGSLSVSPLELTSAFCVFANSGTRMSPIAVKYIVDRDGNVLENNEPRGVTAISPQTAFLTTSMLEDVVKYGTAKRAKALQREAAGKTGTTNDYRDAWFIGFTPELATGVWVGFDNMRPLGAKETGAKAALPIWIDFMKQALTGVSPFGAEDEGMSSFPVPDGIVTAVIDPLTGLLATGDSEKMIEFFKEGGAPRGYSTKAQREAAKKRKPALDDAESDDHEVD
ncbi:MAG: PBP1A family penicillin-binding protein [Nitrospiraceae bacterium]|nr:MAG: PBP1A family penicillin-binding protein [Nitrospiraceae bacterium]